MSDLREENVLLRMAIAGLLSSGPDGTWCQCQGEHDCAWCSARHFAQRAVGGKTTNDFPLRRITPYLRHEIDCDLFVSGCCNCGLASLKNDLSIS